MNQLDQHHKAVAFTPDQRSHPQKQSQASLRLPGVLLLIVGVVLGVGAVMMVLSWSVVPSGPKPIRSLFGHSLWITSVAWSPDGKLVAAAGADTTVLVWDATSGNIVTKLKFRGGAPSVAWSPDSQFLATASDVVSDGVQIWNVNGWHVVQKLNSDPQHLIDKVSWSPDGKELAIGTGNLEIWNVAEERRTAELVTPGAAYSPSWSPDGRLLALGAQTEPYSTEGTVVVWNLANGDGAITSKNATVLNGHTGLVNSVAWSPDGKHVVSGSDDGTVKVWDTTTKQNTATYTGHKDSVVSVAWSPDGKMIASGSWDRTAKVWDVATGQNIATFEHPDFVTTVAWSPDSKYLATGDHSTAAEVRIWEVK